VYVSTLDSMCAISGLLATGESVCLLHSNMFIILSVSSQMLVSQKFLHSFHACLISGMLLQAIRQVMAKQKCPESWISI